MLKGSELVKKKNLSLYYLYQQGSIDSSSGVVAAELQRFIQADDQDFKSLYKHLSKAGLIEIFKLSFGRVGAVKTTPIHSFKLWLTDEGLQAAETIVEFTAQEIKNQQANNRPFGFKSPNQDR